jgi:alkylation response protein AidB-like acyl-CoA dehydrogenase
MVAGVSVAYDGSVIHVIERILHGDVPVIAAAHAQDFWLAAEQMVPASVSPLERALLSGAAADRLGFAFAAGYVAAVDRLVPGVPRPAALAVTEVGGGHPRDIRTTAVRVGEGWRLDGSKSFVTLGDLASCLIVAVSVGYDDTGRNRLRVCIVPRVARGLQLTPGPQVPFAPEIHHCAATLSAVQIPESAMLPGDGYDAFVKPFRTIEDTFVLAASTAYALACATRHELPRPLREDLAALLFSVAQLSLADPLSPAAHIVLGGLIRQAASVWSGFETAMRSLGAEEAERLGRDSALLGVAGRAREQRLKAAWERVAKRGSASECK